MPIKRKIGGIGTGSWSAPIDNGNLRIKRNGISGRTWYPANAVRIKTGSAAAPPYGGAWTDSGMTGYPALPTNFNLLEGTHGPAGQDANCHISWSGGSDGTVPYQFDLQYHQISNDTYGHIYVPYSTPFATYNYTFHAPALTDYFDFSVRSMASNGLNSGYTAPEKRWVSYPGN